MAAESLHADWSWADRPVSSGWITMLHGFAQTNRCWGSLVDELRIDHNVCCIDLPGHGASDLRDADVPATASAMSDLLSTLGDQTNVLLGYSLGARVALQSAVQESAGRGPDALVLISGSPGLRSVEERAARRRADEALADRIEAIGAQAFIDEWLAGPLFSHLDATAQHRSERLRNRPEGLASSLRFAGTGTMEPLWEALGSIDVPVLLIAGTDDAKFATIASDMAGLLPHATLAIIEGAGHTVHLEQPDATISAVRSFLAGLP